MALHTETVTQNTKNLDIIKDLYYRSFPENERSPFEEMVSNQANHIELLAFYDNAQFCGFACLLNTETISHIIYLAIADNLRDKGYGSQVLSAIHKQKAGIRIMVDIERQTEKAKNNGQRQKRKSFYIKNGYLETEIKYRWRQESYEILVHGGNLSKQEYLAFWHDLKEHMNRRTFKDFS